MDWGPVLIFALGGVFNAVIGGMTAEWIAIRSERRRDKAASDDRIRSRNLDVVRQTRKMTVAWCEWRMRSISGARPFDPAEFDDSRWPMADSRYVGEEAAHRMLDLQPLLRGGERDAQIKAMSDFRRAAVSELERQEERALRDEPLARISDELDAQLGD